MPPQISRGYTLIDLLVTMAVLIILMALMVDIAGRVQEDSAQHLTRQLLEKLDQAMDQYISRNQGQPPVVTPLIQDGKIPTESSLQAAAPRNNADVVRVLRTSLSADVFNGLPISLYDQLTLRDGWGSPIVFMPGQHPAIGLPPGNKPFFFSAGPDHQFLTRDDNLYSYEEAEPSGK